MSRPLPTTRTVGIPPHAGPIRQDTVAIVGEHAGALAVSLRFAQILVLILTTHFLCLGAKNATPPGAVPTGVGIFDTLFIGANATFSMKGDLYLRETKVLGKGSLRLNGDSSQRIVSQNSLVTNLDLANAGRVTLSGELHVMQSLTVREGTLEAGRARLQVSDSAQVKLLGGAKLLVRPELLSRIPLTGSMLARMVFVPEAIMPSFGDLPGLGYRLHRVCYKSINRLKLAVNLDIASPPPEKGGSTPDDHL